MKYLYLFWLFLCLWFAISCETPFSPKPTKDEDLFVVSHDYEGGHRIVRNTPITISWSEVTLPDFEKFTVYRSAVHNGEELWEERAEITNPLQVSYTDSLDNDETFRYRVRIEETNGNFRDGETDQIKLRTLSIIVPDEYDSMQEAYDSPFIDDGDTLYVNYVNPNTYARPFKFIDKDILIKGAGKEETILSHGDTVISMNRGILTGFTIKKGTVNLLGTAILSDCIITEVSTRGFKAPVIIGDSAEIRDCLISGNRNTRYYGYGGDGAGLVVRDFGVVRNCRITGNQTTEMGGGISIYGKPVIMNTMIDNNFAERGGGGLFLNAYARPLVVNCVIFKNRAGGSGKFGAVMGGERALTMLNSVVWGNSSFGLESKNWQYASYSNIQGHNRGTGNINVSPRFIAPSEGDFHLLPVSPCIDTGHPGEEYLDVDGTRNDMGAYGGPYGE